MIITINCGHTLTGDGSGAIGFINESEHNRLLGNKVITLLKEQGHTVYNSTVDEANSNLEYISNVVKDVNSRNTDLFLSIHFNAFNGTAKGTEIFTYKGEKHIEAQRIIENISKLGFTNRGLKDGSHLYVIRNTKPKALLLEVCFCDSKADTDLYLKNIDNIAKAIVEGITGTKVIEKVIPDYIKEFEEAKNTLVKMGVTDGSRPKDNVTREEMWTMLYRLLNKI